jgi:chaperonin cofactor prefoldin
MMDSPTIDQGDEASTDSPTVTTSAPEKDLLARMDERMSAIEDEGATEAASTAEDGDDEGEEAAPQSKKKADEGKAKGKKDAKASDADESDESEDKPKPDSIPKKAFDERVGKLTSQKRALQEKLSTFELQNAKLTAALQLAQEELERQAVARQSGEAFSEKDEQLRAYEVEKRARALAAQVERTHRDSLAKQSQADEVAELRQSLGEEISAACGDNDLVDRSELIAHLRLAQNRGRSAAEVAGELQTAKLARAQARFGVAGSPLATAKAKAPAPKTVKAKSNGNAAFRHPANLDGMNARFEELLAANTRE